MLSEPPQSHDYIDFFIASKQGINQRCNELYQSGLSIREIVIETNIPKTSVIEALYAAGNIQSNDGGRKSITTLRATPSRKGVAPYGFAWFKSRLVAAPTEIETVRRIINYWQSGSTLRAITDHLNGHKIKTRNGGEWEHSLIRRIIMRHKKNPKQIEEVLS